MLEFLKKFLGVNEIILPKLSKEEIKERKSWGYHNRTYDFGTIDHQSQGTINDLRASGHTIKEFLLNKDFYLVIDNDNH